MKFAMPAAAVAALMLITIQGARALPECNPANLDQCDDELTTSECLAEFWDHSSAAQTCLSASVRVVDNKCKIEAFCKTGPQSDAKSSTVIVHFQDIRTLRNCSGTLKLGVC